jgi:hypothetical protein
MRSTPTDFRAPTALEDALIRRLLEADFVGKQELEIQLGAYRVRNLDREGSLELLSEAADNIAQVQKRIPVEASGVDEDGIHVHVLLHVVNGLANELEIYKDDGSPIRCLPIAGDLELLVLP